MNFPAHAMTVRLASRTSVAPGIIDATLEVTEGGPLAFAAGQFLTLLLPADGAHEAAKRSYSIASDPGAAPYLRLIVRLVPGGRAASLFADASIGTLVPATGPHGFFKLDAEHPGDVVFAATGTGIAPIFPMLAELARRPRGGRLAVLWGVRHAEDVFLRAELEAACAAAHADLSIFLSRPSADWTGARGHITPAVLALHPTLHAPVYYLVGNGAMITEVKTGLVALGAERKRQIRTESFTE